ncbi:hypothetical protein TUBRATIS_20610 [Tubulinosema ratisbonensis]|uniref:SEP domain-containing protein n=1 Tax=Tubulinosema ratisbonensis TaxID=291195 RepID=A0A437AK41_9MICR|nr:hypothetical protein TUBRATIS_20610 [Tubulinosema ratisbonensis]
MSYDDLANELVSKTCCDYQTALNALEETKGNISEAENLIKQQKFKKIIPGDKKIYNYTGSKSQTATVNTKSITVIYYSNGLKINENFFSYDSETGKLLKKQIENQELDPSLAKLKDLNGSEVVVDVKNKENEHFGEKDYFKGEFKVLNREKKEIKVNLPKKIELSDSQEIRIKVFLNSESCLVTGKKNNKIKDLIDKIKNLENYAGEGIFVQEGNNKIIENENLEKFNGSVLRIFFK